MDDLHVTAPSEGGEEETDFGGHFEPRNVRSYSIEGAGQLVKERKREGGRGPNVMNAKTCIAIGPMIAVTKNKFRHCYQPFVLFIN